MANKTWYLGLDIGSASVGWAATDTEYKIIRKNKKRLWGVRLFEEATTAEDRRGYRSSRRRLARRKWRLNLLEELFASEVKKVDENFFLRLKESQYHYEDKTHKVPYAIFNDKDYTDKDYYKDYPTIYHLRSKLMTEENPDIRKVFLAIHHILKNRGHFLLQGQSFKDGNLNNLIKELLELDILHIEFEVTEEVVGKIADISLEKKTLTDKVNDLKKLYPKEKQLLEVFRLIFGGKTSLDKLFAIDEYKELDAAIKSVSFKEKIYEEVRHDYEQVLSNYIELLDLAKLVYDSIILSDIKKEGKTLSESKVELYEKHKDDLLKLKNLVKNDSKLAEDKKFTNLNHPVFSEKAIVTKALPKADIDTIQVRLSEWQNRVSKEIKFVDFATPAFRQKYAKADLDEKAQLLIEREQTYERKHRQGSSLERASRRQRNHQSNASNTNSRQSKSIARASIGLSSVQGGVVVRGATQRGTRTQSLLSENELNHLRNGEPSINSSLRRNDSSRRRGNARGRIDVKPPIFTLFQSDCFRRAKAKLSKKHF